MTIFNNNKPKSPSFVFQEMVRTTYQKLEDAKSEIVLSNFYCQVCGNSADHHLVETTATMEYYRCPVCHNKHGYRVR